MGKARRARRFFEASVLHIAVFSQMSLSKTSAHVRLIYCTMIRYMGRNILTYGTFDLLHVGHINLLRRAREMGDYLIVGVSTDAFTRKKGKVAMQPYEHRKAIVEALRFVDFVIPEETWEQKIGDLKKYDIQTFVMGSDWEGKFDDLKQHCDVVYVSRTDGVSSTKLRGFHHGTGDLSSVD